jgi:hypothetical protein
MWAVKNKLFHPLPRRLGKKKKGRVILDPVSEK